MDDWVGFRLCPTEDEMVACHLHCKLMGKALQANNFINEINIYSYDPWMLPFQSKVKSRDSVWYFFTLVENNSGNGDRQSRITSSGFWKITGNPVKIYDRWRIWKGNQGEIGFKRVLRFHIGRTANAGKGDWIMHEYHNTMLPQHQRTHVMCRVEYKGDDIRFLSENPTEISPAFVHHLMNSRASVVTHPVQENLGSTSANQNQEIYTQEQGPSLVSNDYEMQMGLDRLLEEESMVDESMVFRGSDYDSTNQNQQEQLPSLASNDNETQMLFNSTIEDFYSTGNESMVMGNSSGFAESKFYLNELCFDSPPDSPLFTYQASTYQEKNEKEM